MLKRSFALVAALLASPAFADTLIDNANGIQVGPDGKIQRFSALVIGDDGKVKTVLASTAHVRLANITQSIDAGGKTLMPGLIDAHGHVIDSPGADVGLGLLSLQLDLSGSTSLDDVLKRLDAYARANPDAPWLVGRGWNQELWADKRFPTAADLDKVVADRPVFLGRVDGHAAVANTAALMSAGITGATVSPAGGTIELDKAGRPTGLLIDNAMPLVGKKLPRPTPALMDRALEAAQESLLSVGITATADMGSSAAGWSTFQRLGEAGRLKVRFLSYFDGSQPLALPKPTGWLYGDKLRAVGVKLYSDGALGSRGAWLKRPYADKPDTTGLRFLSDAELRLQADAAAKAGFQLAIHAIGDAANAQVIGAFEGLSRTYGKDRRWRIEHFQVADPVDIPRLAPAGIIASMQPVHQTSDRTMAEKRLDPPRLAGAYAWQTVLKSGAGLAFGSDYPVESPNPFPGLAAAVSRQDVNGQPPGGWRPEERLSLAQALSAFTRDAAYAGFADDRIGALEPGKWADFILVDRDPTAIDAQAFARTQVLETWVAGRKVWARASGGAERGK